MNGGGTSHRIGDLVFSQLLTLFLLTTLIVQMRDRRARVKRPVDEVLGEALRVFPASLGATLWSGMLIGLGLLALVVPGLMAAARYAVAMPVAVLEPKTRRPIRRSISLTDGHRSMSLALFLTQNFVLVAASGLVLGVVTFVGRTSPTARSLTFVLMFANWYALGFYAALSLTTYTGLLAAERHDLAPQPQPQPEPNGSPPGTA